MYGSTPGHIRFRIALVVTVFCAPLLTSASARAATPVSPAQPAAPAAAPISIADGCSYKTLSSGFGLFGNTELNLGHGYNFFTVKFTNNAAVAANKIVFQIDFGKSSRIVIPDAGTFAPGATTSTTFRDRGKEMTFGARPTPNDGSVICTVLSAQFADGTTYTSPLAPTATPAP